MLSECVRRIRPQRDGSQAFSVRCVSRTISGLCCRNWSARVCGAPPRGRA